MDQIFDCYDNFPDDSIEKGDVNNDGVVDLIDAILVQKFLVGIEPVSGIYIEADANGDNKIGMEEVTYILQKFSELR